jgi:hypothetical protein
MKSKDRIRKAIELLQLAKCPDENCNSAGTVNYGTYQEQCQWCYETMWVIEDLKIIIGDE